MVIRHPTKNEFPALLKLWQDTFDDDKDFIKGFFSAVNPTTNAFCAFDNDVLAGMLFSVPAVYIYNSKPHKANYIYAVATEKTYRGKGIMRDMHSFAEKSAKEAESTAFMLIPANKSLFKLYETLGYQKASVKSFTRIPVCLNKTVMLSDISYEEFIRLRRKNIYEMPEAFDLYGKSSKFRFEQLLSNKNTYLFGVELDKSKGYAIVQQDVDITILESNLKYEDCCALAFELQQRFGKKKVLLFGRYGRQSDYGMIKILTSSKKIEVPIYMKFMLE